MSTCILFKESVSSDKLKKIYQNYPLGLFLKSHLNNLNECKIFDAKMLSKIMLLYTPVRATPNVGIWDLVGNHFGSLEPNSGVWVSEDYKDQLLFSGSLDGLLPIMNIITNNYANGQITNKNHGIELVHKYLEVISKSLRSVEGQDESKEKFMKAFFMLFEKLPRDFLHIKTIRQLDEIRYSSQKVFFTCLIRSADIWVNCSTSIQKEYWRFVNDIYLQDPAYFHDIFSVQDLIEYTLKLSEVKETMSSSTPKLASGTLKDTREDSGMQELSLILSVVEKLFIKGGDQMSENIKHLTPVLTSKASASFKYEILKLLKVLLVDSKEDPICPSPLTFAEYFIENNGLHILLYLCTNSPLNVVSMCLKLIDVLSSLKKSKKLDINTDVIPFLSSVITSKIKEKPALYTPSGHGPKKFDLMSKGYTTESINELEEIDDIGLSKMSTQNFETMKLGLEVNVEEANKHFNNQNKNKFQSSEEFLFLDNPDEEEKTDHNKTSGVSNYESSQFMKR